MGLYHTHLGARERLPGWRLTMNRVILEKVHEVLNIFAIVDGHDLELARGVLYSLSEHKTPNASKSVDSYLD